MPGAAGGIRGGIRGAAQCRGDHRIQSRGAGAASQPAVPEPAGANPGGNQRTPAPRVLRSRLCTEPRLQRLLAGPAAGSQRDQSHAVADKTGAASVAAGQLRSGP